MLKPRISSRYVSRSGVKKRIGRPVLAKSKTHDE
jgi:hypothetical protein